MIADPIIIEVINNGLLSIAREMRTNLVRTAHSTIVYETHDFGLGIYDAECRLMAEAPGLAVFTRGNDFGLRKIVAHLGVDALKKGDVILSSYPYWSSSHPLDVLCAAPIILGGELVGFSAVKQHWIDLGQRDPGYNLSNTEVFHEGLLMPASKIYEEGRLNRGLLDIIRFNSRFPDIVEGDLHAQVAACRTGEQRLLELIDKYGLETYRDAVGEIFAHGERLSRARLARLPRGVWTAEDFVDDDGITLDKTVSMKVTVTVTDSEMVIDWSGSSPAVPGPINVPLGMTEGVSALAFKALTTPDTPANDGNFRPLRVIAPPGCLFNAQPPAPTFTLWPALHAPELVMKALSKGMPELVPACSGGDIFAFFTLGTHPVTGRAYSEGSNEAVGFGAHSADDGEDGLMHMAEPGCRNNPVEMMERKAPLLVEHYRLRQDSGGAGLHRGGLGASRRYRFLSDALAFVVGKKYRSAPWGMLGGKSGGLGGVTVTAPSGETTRHGMVTGTMKAGTVLTNEASGGGGWGNPLDRPPARVLEDVRKGYVSLRGAREDYGVVIDADSLEIDWDGTAKLREKRRVGAVSEQAPVD